ncbi:hypothetical protein G7Y79_00019g046530 [Physcia stellaris]|nr:hypothetical protein G7Y79_00019g046530 [Physcia stellaris]
MLKQTRNSDVSPNSIPWQNFWSSKQEDNRARDNSAAFQLAMRKKITPEEQNYLKHADAASLELILSRCHGNAEVQRDLKERSKGLIKRAGKSTEVFANNFASYLQAYSGIIEIMQGVDNQYGGVAYASLSLLLIVAVNKQRKEERIDSTLLDLQREFLRIGMLKESHSSRIIKDIEATRYYSRSSYRRILEAITRPPSLEFDAKISEISKAMAEIQKEISALDSQRLFEVQRSLDIVEGKVNIVEKNVDNVKEQVDNVRGDLEGACTGLLVVQQCLALIDVLGSQAQIEKERLQILKAKLLPNGFDPRDELDRYSSAVRETFKNPVKIQNLNINRVVEDSAFSRWENSRKSTLMLLHGSTAITRGDYSWLSPSVFHLITHYRQQGKTALFHCCHNSVFMEEDTPVHAVISSLEIISKSSSPQWQESSSNDAWKVFQVLLGLVPEVYILLDRVDRIRGSAHRFLSSLVNLIQSSQSIIKVFLVASSNRQGHREGKMTEELLESTGEELGPQQFLRLRLDQK